MPFFWYISSLYNYGHVHECYQKMTFLGFWKFPNSSKMMQGSSNFINVFGSLPTAHSRWNFFNIINIGQEKWKNEYFQTLGWSKFCIDIFIHFLYGFCSPIVILTSPENGTIFIAYLGKYCAPNSSIFKCYFFLF